MELRYPIRSRVQELLISMFSILLAPLAALAEDDTTQSYISGTATNVGQIVVGDTGTNNFLVISNATRVLTSTGTVGVATSANFNNALLTGPGTFWTNTQWFVVGSNGSFNTLVVSNGARLVTGQTNQNVQTMIGRGPLGSNNTVIVTGTNTAWIVRNLNLRMGLDTGGGNQLLISDGAQVVVGGGSVILGDGAVSSPSGGRNIVTISGSNSLLLAGSLISVGRFSPNNQVVVTNGGRLVSAGATIGVTNPSETNNSVIVTGAGSVWDSSGDIRIQRAHNMLLIEDGGSVSAPTNLLGIAFNTGTRNNMVRITDGSLAVTNAAGTGFYDIIRGSNVLNGGTLTVDSVRMTNSVNSLFLFHGGTFNTKNSTFSNVALFVVGNGTSSATLNLQGGSHQFFNGLQINTNATLKGTGTLEANTTVIGKLSPGASPGLLTITGNLTLASNAVFEVELDGTTPGTLYDQVDVTGTVNISNSILTLDVSFSPTTNDLFTIIVNDGSDAVLGTFQGLTENAFIDASSPGVDAFFRISYIGGTGNDVVLTATIPEPSALLLFGAGLLVLALRRK